jgi:hypothetical protein
LTRTIARNTTSFIDVVEQNTDIYIGNSRVKIINPNKVIRPVSRHTLTAGTFNLSNLPKTNLNNASVQDAIILIQAPGGGGASGRRYFAGPQSAGGGGGGAGGTALIKLQSVNEYSISLGTGGTGGIFDPVGIFSDGIGYNGSDGEDAKIKIGLNDIFVVKGGGGGIQRNQTYTLFGETSTVINEGGLPGKITNDLPSGSYIIYSTNGSSTNPNTYHGTFTGSVTDSGTLSNQKITLTTGIKMSDYYLVGDRVEKESGTAILRGDSRITSIVSEETPSIGIYNNSITLSGIYNPDNVGVNGTLTFTIYKSGFGGRCNEIGRDSVLGTYNAPVTLGSLLETNSNTSNIYITRLSAIMGPFLGGALNGDNNFGRGGSGAASLFANGGIGPFGLNPDQYIQSGSNGIRGSGGGGSSSRATKGNIVSGSNGGAGFIIVFY